MPIGLEQWRMQIGVLEAQRYRYLCRAARKAARGGRSRICRVSAGRGTRRCWVGLAVGVTLLSLAVSFSLLLLRAGDIEKNPGPLSDQLLSAIDNSELTEDDLHDVYYAVRSLAGRWRCVHLSLRLSASERDAITATYPNHPHDCLQEGLLKWLRKTYNFQRYGPPTWRMLVEAVADPAGGNDPALAEIIAKGHQVMSPPSKPQAAVGSSGHTTTLTQQQQPDSRTTHDLCRKFAETFENITNILDKSVNVLDLKRFLHYYCHPLYPEQRYIEPMIYEGAQTTAKVLDALFPQYINYMNHFLLESIVDRFRSDEAKILLQEYTKHLHDCQKRKLSTFPDPITDEEAELFRGVKKLKVTSQESLEHAVVKYLEEVKLVLEKTTGISKGFIPYSSHDEGSVILYFLIPEVICHIFHDLGGDDLTILADSGVTRLEIDEFVIKNIQSYATLRTSTEEVESSGEDRKYFSLEYHLRERKTEMDSDKHTHLLKMFKSVTPSELHKQCSETLLADFADSLKDWKKLAPYFGITEQCCEELEEHYPDIRDQKYQALLCWRRMDVDTATYHNLLETLLLHGDVEEVEALLGRMGPDPAVLHLSESLKQKYLDYDSWHAWRDVPNLMEFDQRLGELTKDAPVMLKRLDYSDCPESVDQYPSFVTPVSVKSLINSIASTKRPVVLIKGPLNQGKSYLLSKVCQYWAKGFGLRRFTLVLWMNLASVNTSIDSLEGLLTQVTRGDIVKDVCHWVETTNGKDVLFLLDGWHHSVKQRSIFHKLVSRQYLTESTVVVTSTFTMLQLDHSYMYWSYKKQYIQYEMMGLTHTQISKQIIRYHELNPTRAEELLHYLASNPDMQLLSHTPVNLFAVLLVSQSVPPSDHDFPHSKTEFFMRVTVLMLQTNFPEYHLLPYLSSLHTAYREGQLPPLVHTFLEKLSQAAMNLLDHQDSYVHVDVDPLLLTGFTFFHLEEPRLANNQCVKFIIHDIIDFLAAVHIHHLSKVEAKEELMKKAFPWSFYAGFYKEEYLSVLSSLLGKHCGNDTKKLVSCAYEANITMNIPDTTITGCILTIADIHHIIAASQNIHEMIFENCCLGTDASLQLSKAHLYFHPQLPLSGCSEHHFQFLDCVFSEKVLDCLHVTTVEEVRLHKLSIKVLQVFSSVFVFGPRSFNFHSCEIGDEGATVLSKALRMRHNHTLRTLNLASNGIHDSGVQALAEGLCHNNSLQELDLSYNVIGDEGATALSEALRVNHTLTTLNITMNKIHASGVQALAKGLCHNNSLQELDLSDNVIGNEGATALSKVLRVNHTLRTLSLTMNKIHASGVQALAKGLCHNNSLQELDLSDNVIGNEGATALSKVLRVNHTLRTLSLARNWISYSRAQALAEGLFHNDSLQELDLSDNLSGDEGTTALSKALRVNYTLRTLNLYDNAIGDEGATALSEALKVNHTLRTLNLAKNVTLASGAQALAEGLCHNNSLQKLDLSDNDIRDLGAIALSKALRFNHTLRTLNLARNRIHFSGARHLAIGLCHNNFLQELDLSDNQFGNEGATAFSKALSVNHTLKTLMLTTSPSHPIWLEHKERLPVTED